SNSAEFVERIAANIFWPVERFLEIEKNSG
ncbi:MAG: hypothetical protein RL598_2042, partial [Verrucomicrobiota bacterium]